MCSRDYLINIHTYIYIDRYWALWFENNINNRQKSPYYHTNELYVSRHTSRLCLGQTIHQRPTWISPNSAATKPSCIFVQRQGIYIYISNIFTLSFCNKIINVLTNIYNNTHFRISEEIRLLGWNVPASDLSSIPEHWLTYPEPNASLHYLLGLLYVAFTIVALIGNGLVIWVFTSYGRVFFFFVLSPWTQKI